MYVFLCSTNSGCFVAQTVHRNWFPRVASRGGGFMNSPGVSSKCKDSKGIKSTYQAPLDDKVTGLSCFWVSSFVLSFDGKRRFSTGYSPKRSLSEEILCIEKKMWRITTGMPSVNFCKCLTLSENRVSWTFESRILAVNDPLSDR